MVTCFSTLKRGNHSVGERLGKGEKLSEILASMSAVLKEFRQLPLLMLSPNVFRSKRRI
jgi:glycerol-3-phosphate dehydrogenase